MAVIQKEIIVPDNLLPGIMSGAIDIMGLAKNVNNGRIIKHLDAFDSDDSNSAALAVQLIVVGVAAVGGIGVGVQREARREVTEYVGQRFHVHAVL